MEKTEIHEYIEKLERTEDISVAQAELEEEDDSPIEEVRLTVPNTDDTSVPCNTFRMWSLGLAFTAVISFINEFFFLRQTQVTIGYSVVALVSLPIGHAMARILPTREFSIFGWSFTLNPGPFSLKEHILIGTMVSCNTNAAYAVDIIVLQNVFYGDRKPFIAGLLLVWTTQMMGFAFAGIIRRFLVRPAHMIWPATLVTASLFSSLHASSRTKDDEGRTSRMKYYLLVSLGSFTWYWFPGLIFPTIGAFSWICWIKPDNVILSQLTGSYGLGIGTFTLDWTAVTSYMAPLATPWFAQFNILIGLILVVYVTIPLAYYTNLWGAKNYPILSAGLFRENGTPYNKSMILTNNVLDEEKYLAYGPARLSSFFALAYGIGFAGLAATVVHCILYNGPEIVARWKSARAENEDIHSRLMRFYPEVPDWWYAILGLITLALSIVTCVVWNYMPWWAVFLALGVAIFFVLPVGVVQAVTNQQPGLNIVTEYVIGYILPGHPIANVTFKTYGYIVNTQALAFTQDLKLGHYMKIPPRVMFWAQVISTIISGLINLATAVWLIDTRPNICTKQGYPFTCLPTQTFYSASIIWGAIGPARMFGSKDGALYGSIQYAFIVGAALPAITWAISKKFPRITWLQYVHWPVLLAATSNIPPGLPFFFTNALFVGFIFMFVLRRYRFSWWARYNYLTSAGLDTGVAFSAIIIFAAVQSWDGHMTYWWGSPKNQVWDHCPLGSANFYGN